MPPKAGSGRSAKNYCWTYNRPTDTSDDDWEELIERIQLVAEAEDVVYHVFQYERGSGTERDHLQGYTVLNRRCTMIGVKRDYFHGLNVWLTTARGTPQQNKVYCTKESTRISGPWEFGVVPGGQGRRSDLENAADVVQTRGPGQVAIDMPGVYIRHYRGLHALDAQLTRMNCPALRDQSNCAVIWGPTDLGKSHVACTMDSGFDTYIVPVQNTGNLWFDGYSGQRTIIFDDFDPGTVPYRTLLRICDRYRLELPIKGGFVMANWTNVVFTCNQPPNLWYPHELYEHGPLERRLGLVVQVSSRDECGLFKAAFITRFFPEIPLEEVFATVVPEVNPEVVGNRGQQPRETASQSDASMGPATELQDAHAFVGGFDPEALQAFEVGLEDELAAFESFDELTEPFGTFTEE